MDKNKNSDQHKDLRKQAEEILQHQPEEIQNMSKEDIQSLIHELHTHQIELDVQNNELRLIQQELSISHDQYFELYDLAPVGYFTIGEKGLIQKANLTGANLIGISKSNFFNKPFNHFIFSEDQDEYYFLSR
jgi:two-component system cell cycle sensor histidine kinase/response regulator CckA